MSNNNTNSHNDQADRSTGSDLSSAHLKPHQNLPHQQHFQQHLQQPHLYPNAWLSMIHPPNYSGVDKLILAAMMEESANTAAMARVQQHEQQSHTQLSLAQPPPPPPSGYIPCGRGIGYLHMRENSMDPPTPSNKSELELYRLLERSNLLAYYGTFLSFGGDDVQQLSDADEDEFLEIMSLVGMTQKPLHVRRMQKALIEWRETKNSGSSFKVPNSNYIRDTSNLFANDSRRQPSPDPSLLVESPATTPNSLKSLSVVTSPESKRLAPPRPAHHAANHQQQCPLPHEVLIGAPKRPRLMDSILTQNRSKVGSEESPDATNQTQHKHREQSWE